MNRTEKFDLYVRSRTNAKPHAVVMRQNNLLAYCYKINGKPNPNHFSSVYESKRNGVSFYVAELKFMDLTNNAITGGFFDLKPGFIVRMFEKSMAEGNLENYLDFYDLSKLIDWAKVPSKMYQRYVDLIDLSTTIFKLKKEVA